MLAGRMPLGNNPNGSSSNNIDTGRNVGETFNSSVSTAAASSNNNKTILSKLASRLAVHPSRDWLRACTDHLQRKHQRAATLEMVLLEILHSDLRDVVRPLHGAAGTVQASSKPLRDAIFASRLPSNNYTESLPESFQLLCQLEEAVDVAKSAEQKKQISTRSATSCFKVCLSDGYQQHQQQQRDLDSWHIEGIESLPINGLVPSIPSGSKVLLKGPLQANHGILLLHPGNFVLLGGYFDALVEHQSEALAKIREGAGVDPTVRALIQNNNNNNTIEDDEDEAHNEASGDVVAVSNQNRNNVTSVAASISSSTISNSFQEPLRRQQQEQKQQQYPRSLSPPMVGRKRNASQISNPSNSIVASNSLSTSSYHQQQQQQQQQQQRQRQPVSTMKDHSVSTQSYTLPSRNPYQSTAKQQQQISRNRPTETSQTHVPVAARITPTSNNVIRNHNTNNNNFNYNSKSINKSTNSTNPYKSTQQQQQQQSNNHHIRKAGFATLNASRSSMNPSDANRSETKPSVAMKEPIASASSPHFLYSTSSATALTSSSNVVQKMSFANLQKLLLQLVSDRNMYEAYYRKKIIFNVVLSVPDQTQHDFNVVKIPKQQHSKHGKSPIKNKKKYEYFTSARFAGSSEDASMPIACQIHPDLLESCFEVSANDLRALSRTDRPKCTSITNGGGEAVRKTYFGSRVWGATLHKSKDQVFGESSGGSSGKTLLKNLKNPILLLRNQSA